MGTGILYGREKLLEELPPYQGGGEMIKNVTFEKTTYNELPLNLKLVHQRRRHPCFAGSPEIYGRTRNRCYL